MIRWGMTVEMLDLLTRIPVSGRTCVCHEPRVFGHQIGCIPGRSIPMDLGKQGRVGTHEQAARRPRRLGKR